MRETINVSMASMPTQAPLQMAPQLDESFRKSIPAQVFLNHYFAMDLDRKSVV